MSAKNVVTHYRSVARVDNLFTQIYFVNVAVIVNKLLDPVQTCVSFITRQILNVIRTSHESHGSQCKSRESGSKIEIIALIITDVNSNITK